MRFLEVNRYLSVIIDVISALAWRILLSSFCMSFSLLLCGTFRGMLFSLGWRKHFLLQLGLHKRETQSLQSAMRINSMGNCVIYHWNHLNDEFHLLCLWKCVEMMQSNWSSHPYLRVGFLREKANSLVKSKAPRRFVMLLKHPFFGLTLTNVIQLEAFG